MKTSAFAVLAAVLFGGGCIPSGDTTTVIRDSRIEIEQAYADNQSTAIQGQEQEFNGKRVRVKKKDT